MAENPEQGEATESNPESNNQVTPNTNAPTLQASSPGFPVTLAGIKPPSNLNLKENVTDNWKSYKQRWENYEIVANLAAQPEKFKVALFLHCLGAEALKVFNGLSFDSEEDRQNLSKIMQKLDEYTIGEVNETYERYVFNCRNQGAEESVEAYITELRKLTKTCNFCDCLKDTLLRDRIVLGVSHKHLRKKLLQERKLTLKKCVDICRSFETASTQFKAVSGAGNEDINKVVSYNQRKPRQFKQGRNEERSTGIRSCRFCGGEHSLQKEQCPAWGKYCLNCGGRNHFARKCSKPRNEERPGSSVKQIGEAATDSESSDIEFITSITMSINAVDVGNTTNSGYPKEIFAMMEIDNKAIRFQIDCGASINVITQDLIGDCAVTPTNKALLMWNKSEVTPLGSVRLILRNPQNKKKYSVEFVVVRKGLIPLIGAKAAQHMKLLTVHKENFVTASPPNQFHSGVKQLTSAEELVKKFSEVFDRPVGTFPGTVHLEVEPEVQPVIIPARRIPTALKEPFKEELNKLVAQEIIKPVEQPTPWVSSLVVTTKKSGALRICVDPRPLNKALKRETYQMPVLDNFYQS